MSYEEYLASVYLSTVTSLNEERLDQLVARNGVVGAAEIVANAGNRPVDWELEACRTLDRARGRNGRLVTRFGRRPLLGGAS